MLRRVYVLAVTFALITALTPAATSAHNGGNGDRALKRYAAATWLSFDRLVDSRTGLPADYIDGDLHPRSRAAFTSPTNIAMYLWATLAARDLGLIGSREATKRIDATLTSVERLERHVPSGQFYNWYDPATLEKITVWPVDGSTVYPFLSSVDNGWLASGLLMVANAVPKLRHRAWALAKDMDFGCYYDPLAKGVDVPGLIRGGFWRTADAPPPGTVPFPLEDYCEMGETVAYTVHHYGSFNTEPRIASDIGIALGQIPPKHYFAPWRTFPDTCDWSWSETKPVGEWRKYLGVDVFEGAYRYDDQLVVPTWGGSMFEALMPALVVPELEWGRRSWGVTHPLYVESQIEFGLEEAGYGYWGFSPSSDPSSDPAGGYREYGVDAIGMLADGYSADVDRLTLVDEGWDDPACIPPRPPPTSISDYGQGVVTPHASFLALEVAPDAALENLANLKSDFPGLYGRGGFKDAVNVATRQVADRYLALDQGMVIAAIANELLDGRFRDYLAVTLRPSLKPLMAMEQFGAGRLPP
jgi:hypothetical protein